MSDFGAPASQPAGWYYAEGDPPGTHRYWDGTQWTGGPQPVQISLPGAGPAQHLVEPAGVEPRILAWLIDLFVAFIPLIGLALAGGSDEQLGFGYIALLVVFLGNQVVLQGPTGQTIGKKVVGLMLVTEVSGETVGILRALGRFVIAGLLSNFPVGYTAWQTFFGPFPTVGISDSPTRC